MTEAYIGPHYDLDMKIMEQAKRIAELEAKYQALHSEAAYREQAYEIGYNDIKQRAEKAEAELEVQGKSLRDEVTFRLEVEEHNRWARIELKKTKPAFDALKAERDEALAVCRKLRPYCKHLNECAIYNAQKCDCGWAEVLDDD